MKPVHLPEIDAEDELLIGINTPKVLEPLEVVHGVDVERGSKVYGIDHKRHKTRKTPLPE